MMNQNLSFIYSFANASLTLRVVEHLRDRYQKYLHSVTTINLIDRWIVRVSLKNSLVPSASHNLQCFLQEMGFVIQPTSVVLKVLASLDTGESPVAVMNRYQVVVVAYGQPTTEEIEIFRQQIVERLGYCPQTMA